jgi:hypothetical protein
MVKGAHEPVSRDHAPMAQVGAEVRAQGVEDAGHAVLSPEEHELATEGVDGLHRAPAELVAIGHGEPARGIGGEWVSIGALFHELAPRLAEPKGSAEPAVG